MSKNTEVVTPIRSVGKKADAADRSSVSRGAAEVYTVRAKSGMDTAFIFLRCGKRSPDEHWGTISVSSGFGELGHTFSNTGPRSLKRFLTGLEFHYLTSKLFGEHARVFDLDKSIENMRKAISDAEQSGDIAPGDAAEAYEALRLSATAGISDAAGMSMLLTAEASQAFTDLELWHDFATKPNPQAIGFWEEIWLPFVKHLHAEVSTGNPQAA